MKIKQRPNNCSIRFDDVYKKQKDKWKRVKITLSYTFIGKEVVFSFEVNKSKYLDINCYFNIYKLHVVNYKTIFNTLKVILVPQSYRQWDVNGKRRKLNIHTQVTLVDSR